MSKWRIVGASVQGTSHQQNDVPCQDAHGYRVLLNGAVVIAVADGAGTASRSHEGAQRAVKQALDTLERDLAYNVLRTEFEWQRLMTAAFRQAREDIVGHARWENAPLRDFAATLTCAVASNDELAVGQIGDCLAVARKGPDDPLFVAAQPQRGEYANETFFLTLEDALDHLQVHVYPPVQTLVLMSDGVVRLAVNVVENVPHTPFFRPLLDFAAEMKDEKTAQEQLAAFLASERVCARTDDDKTLVLAVSV
ncbi:MAG: protein phosphatase 2C domain-containing protein [Anaerolineae bacterium]|nr:protein phosphatase 2C domain-containing protein [Anaerolineae bacterium]